MPLLGLGVWQVPDGPIVRAGCDVGPGARLPPHRHRAGLRKRGERRAGRSRDSGIARDELFVTTKFHPRRRDPLGERSARSLEQTRARLRRPLPRPLARRRTPPGPGPAWRLLARAATPARSASRTSTRDELDQILAGVARRPGRSIRFSFNPSAYRKALLDACAERGHRARGLQPAGHRHTPQRPGRHEASQTASGEPRRRSCCAGASSAASRSSPSPPTATASRRTRKIFDFELAAGEHGAARRARSIRRNPSARWSANGGEPSAYGQRGERRASVRCLGHWRQPVARNSPRTNANSVKRGFESSRAASSRFAGGTGVFARGDVSLQRRKDA